jgi:ketosteroid isomerase-like protein
MHANGLLVERLYASLNQHLSEPIAECYDDEATFRDIAFDLRGKADITAMWGMICDTDIETRFEVVTASEDSAVARVVDEYTFVETGRRVRNVIESRFCFRGGLIVQHVDLCDPHLWAAMALGGVPGFFAGRFRLLRSLKARSLLRDFKRRQSACFISL